MDGMAILQADPSESVIYDALIRATDEAVMKLQERQAKITAAAVSKLFRK